MSSAPIGERLKVLERLHLTCTLVDCEGQDIYDIVRTYNDVAAHDDFDPLPEISTRQAAARLNVLSMGGCAEYELVATRDPRWRPTDKARAIADRVIANQETDRPADA